MGVADDPSKQDEGDRSQVAGGEDFEVDYLAKKAGIYTEKTRRLIDQFGNDYERQTKQARNLV